MCIHTHLHTHTHAWPWTSVAPLCARRFTCIAPRWCAMKDGRARGESRPKHTRCWIAFKLAIRTFGHLVAVYIVIELFSFLWLIMEDDMLLQCSLIFVQVFLNKYRYYTWRFFVMNYYYYLILKICCWTEYCNKHFNWILYLYFYIVKFLVNIRQSKRW